MEQRSVWLTILLLTVNFAFSQQPPHYFSWDTSKGKIPLTHLKFNTDTSLVQFAILSDRTGGMTPGIFEDAVEKVNLLQPQFIMSVGDLINGYSTDKKLIDGQWNEFNAIIKPLTVPFFYVPGNHDISNSWMQQDWLNRFGQPHYYFLYKNVLFISLNSQDDGDYGMKPAQVDYFKSVIEKHPNVKWTFLFMHQPLWGKKNSGFDKIETALQNRNYTVFAGHTHNYVLSKRNNRKYFILATTGGGSERRGEQFGEFDHITWVTLNDKEPIVTHIKLDGVVKEDIVDEALKKKIQPLTSGNWLNVEPSLLSSGSESAIPTNLIFRNTGELPLEVKGSLAATDTYQFNPSVVDLIVPPGSEKKLPVTLNASKTKQPIQLSQLAPVFVELNGSYQINNKAYTLPSKKRWLLNWPQTIYQQKTPLKEADKDTTGYVQVNYPEQIDEDWDWEGAADCHIKFKLAKDRQYLYVSAIVRDDQFILQKGSNTDKLHFFFEDVNKQPIQLIVTPEANKTSYRLMYMNGQTIPQPISCTGKIQGNEWHVLIKLPLKEIGMHQGMSRFNIAYDDQDDPNSSEYATLFWKPKWGSSQDYPGSGMFTH